jgi:hypothetical protein
MIKEEENNEDSTMCEKKFAHVMDTMGRVIHIFQTFFNFIC